MGELLAKVRELIELVCDEASVHLVGVELRGHIGSQVLKVYVDTDQGITLEEITRLARLIDARLEEDDVMPGAYRLEVSSPGVDSGLKYDWQYRRSIGRNLWVRFEQNDEVHEYTGKLVSLENNQLELQLKKEKITIPLASIVKARVQLKW